MRAENLSSPPQSVEHTDYDVVILGGALSGASTALLLKRDLPQLRVLILERRVKFDKKVGESTSEVAGSFLSRVLHQSSYLAAHHINKHGLRMWFNHSNNADPYVCSEVGPRFQSRLPTYQLDRSKLDEHLLAQAVELGCKLVRPATVKAVHLSESSSQVIEFRTEDGTLHKHSTQWVLDASGKAALLSRKLGLHKPLAAEHPTSALWTRYRGVNDVDSAATRAGRPEFTKAVWAPRSVATNHLVGDGWWCWLIPLSDGTLSVGIVWDHTVFDLPPGPNLQERLHTHLLSHPVGKLMFEKATPEPGDTHYHKGPAYYSEQMCGHRWALLGDAAGFIDPLYSQGIDYCGHTICAVTHMLGKHFRGQDYSKEHQYLSGGAYGRSYRYWFEALYKGKYHYMGDAELMWAAFLMDLSTYFIGPVRLVYSNPQHEWIKLPYDGKAGAFFAKFMAFYNSRLKRIAHKRKAKGIFGLHNLNERYLLKENFAANFSSFKLLWKGIKVWLRAEITTALAASRTLEKPAPTTASTVVSAPSS
jgi:flavin-dependent dehydrogenase